MPFDITVLAKKVQGLKEAFDNGRFGDALVGALNAGRGFMNQRIFRGTEDIEGNSFGQYIGAKGKLSDRAQLRALFGTASKTVKKRIKATAGQELTPWQRKRALLGKQTAKKDLFYTGALASSIEVAIEGERAAVLQFNNTEAAEIARGQENQITNIRATGKGYTTGDGVKIFTLNQSEREQVVEQGAELIKQILKVK